MPFFQLLSRRQRRWEGSTRYYTAEEEIGVSMYIELLRGKSYFKLIKFCIAIVQKILTFCFWFGFRGRKGGLIF